MHQFSNVLKIPQFTDYYKEFIQRMEQKLNSSETKAELPIISLDKANEKGQKRAIMQETETFRFIETPKAFVSKLKAEDYEGIEVKRYDDISPYDNKFIIDVNVVDVSPKKMDDCLNILCDNCHSTYPSTVELNPIRKFRCTNCKKEVNGIIHFNMVLQCIENMYTNKILILHLCTYDGFKDDNLLGISAIDCYHSEQGIEALNQKISQLLQKDSFIRVKCETFQTGDKDAHYIYRIIGEYEQA